VSILRIPIHAVRASLILVLAAAPLSSPVSAQIPGIIEPFDNVTDLYNRANRLYEYGRDSKDYGASRNALRNSIPLFREFINTAPRHKFAQRSWYRLGMALLLTGETPQAEHCFNVVIRQYRTGHYVASAAYRLAAQRYNAKDWDGAAPFFGLAAREADKDDLRSKSLYYQARCLILAGKSEPAMRVLNTIISNPRNPFIDYARLAVGQLHAAAGRHEIALQEFEQLLAPQVAPQERAQALLSAGESAAKLGKTELAEGYLHKVLSIPGIDNTFKVRAQLALMEARFVEEDYKAVVSMLHRGDFSGNNAIQARVFMLGGRALAKLDRHHEAIRYFFNVERLAPLSEFGFEASYRRLVSFYQVNGPNLAAQCDAFLDIYGENFPGHKWLARARLIKAETLFHRGSVAQAGSAYARINPDKIDPKLRADVLFKRGWCLCDSGDYNGATQSLTRFISNYPESPDLLQALAKRGSAYLKLSDRSSALKDFERLLASEPDNKLAAYAQQQCARIFREERKYALMIERYLKVLNDFGTLRQATEANAYYWIGWGHFKLEEWEKAIAPLERARSLDPKLYKEPASTRLVLVAYSLQDTERLKAEVMRFREELPGKPLPNKLLTWLGLQLYQKGDFDHADTFLGLASNPDDPANTDLIVWRHLAKARLELRHFERALKVIPFILDNEESAPLRADAYLDQSHILVGLGRWEEAREMAQEGLALDPKGAVLAGVLITLGDIAVQRKDFESAAAHFRRAAELFPNDQEITPLSLARAADACEKNGQAAEAAEIRRILATRFPSWNAPDRK
jgi:tetratricopeptide (TPR) repeat protein